MFQTVGDKSRHLVYYFGVYGELLDLAVNLLADILARVLAFSWLLLSNLCNGLLD